MRRDEAVFRDCHEYQLYLAIENIDHTKTKASNPQTNGICERFHKTVIEASQQVAFRKEVYRTLEELQADLDLWTTRNRLRVGRTPVILSAAKDLGQSAIHTRSFAAIRMTVASQTVTITHYNEERPYSGKYYLGKTPCKPPSTRSRWPKPKYSA